MPGKAATMMGGGFGSAVDKAEHYAQGILNLLSINNDKLDKVSHQLASAPSRKLSKLDVISEAQLRSIPAPENVMTLITPGIQGVYVKVNHWAMQLGAKGEGALFYGNDQQQFILDTGLEGINIKGDPNELVVPPGRSIYALTNKAAIVTLSLTSYQLSL